MTLTNVFLFIWKRCFPFCKERADTEPDTRYFLLYSTTLVSFSASSHVCPHAARTRSVGQPLPLVWSTGGPTGPLRVEKSSVLGQRGPRIEQAGQGGIKMRSIGDILTSEMTPSNVSMSPFWYPFDLVLSMGKERPAPKRRSHHHFNGGMYPLWTYNSFYFSLAFWLAGS